MEQFDKMYTTKPFMSGRSQAIRIPKEYRLEDKEVVINRIGESIVITPKDALRRVFFYGLSLMTDDFMQEGRPIEAANKKVEL